MIIDSDIYFQNPGGYRKLIKTGIHNGIRYYVVSHGSFPTAYVSVPKGWKEFIDTSSIKCHGGVTYEEDWLEADGIKLNNHFYIGWDYFHCGDYYKSQDRDLRTERDGHVWTLGELISECEKVAEQVKRMVEDNIKEEKEKSAFSLYDITCLRKCPFCGGPARTTIDFNQKAVVIGCYDTSKHDSPIVVSKKIKSSAGLNEYSFEAVVKAITEVTKIWNGPRTTEPTRTEYIEEEARNL
jgi:hypothetical protein